MVVRVLAVGDVTGKGGLAVLSRELRRFITKEKIDFTVVNGENADVVGARTAQIERIFEAGADVVTMGNHTYSRNEIIPMLEEEERLLRPANFSSRAPGHGYTVCGSAGPRILVISLIGRVFMDVGPENPFFTADRILERTKADIRLIDFHAEATSEKMALAYYLDGRVSAVWGTHTHVQTSDERILQGGTGYITDIGTTGPVDSILGVRVSQSVSRFLGYPPERYAAAEGPAKLEGAVFDIDPESGKCLSVERVRIVDQTSARG
ncbi:MAG: TIGR00282 family metallophosphoesterase [Oscillospiraceae bacterium]|nr:TIGR00282 family metallophosphoesterase [Oscillospiraceae bacterium]